jgi:hypothetical protein
VIVEPGSAVAGNILMQRRPEKAVRGTVVSVVDILSAFRRIEPDRWLEFISRHWHRISVACDCRKLDTVN